MTNQMWSLEQTMFTRMRMSERMLLGRHCSKAGHLDIYYSMKSEFVDSILL